LMSRFFMESGDLSRMRSINLWIPIGAKIYITTKCYRIKEEWLPMKV
jgi:hypothetical protein